MALYQSAGSRSTTSCWPLRYKTVLVRSTSAVRPTSSQVRSFATSIFSEPLSWLLAGLLPVLQEMASLGGPSTPTQTGLGRTITGKHISSISCEPNLLIATSLHCRLIVLHAWILLLLITASTNGFDNSLMNSFQSLNQWTTYFNNPEGGKLGLLNAIQVGTLWHYVAPLMHSSDRSSIHRTLAHWVHIPSRPTCLMASVGG